VDTETWDFHPILCFRAVKLYSNLDTPQKYSDELRSQDEMHVNNVNSMIK
jgi:hypothetical protein